jgi:hypothetical protein
LHGHGFRFAGYSRQDPRRGEANWPHQANPLLNVEVHTNLVHGPSLQPSISLTYAEIEDDPTSPAALLMIALMHGAMHNFEKLRYLVDICQAARALPTVEQERALDRLATRTGGRLAARFGLELAGRAFAEPRCLELAKGLGKVDNVRFARMLIGRSVVLSADTRWRNLFAWRRNGFRTLLKRGERPGIDEERGAAPAGGGSKVS